MTALRRRRLRRWTTSTLTALVAGIGGLILGVGSNALYGLFTADRLSSAAHDRIAMVAILALVGAAVFAGFLGPLLRRVFAPRYPGLRAAQFTKDIPRRPALITLVSLPRADGGNPAETAILYHLRRHEAGGEPLETCWLLHTDGSALEVERLRRDYPSLNCYGVPLRPRGAQDPSVTYMAVRGAFEQAQVQGLRPDDVIADATGGTKPMTIGMALACRELGLSMEYITVDYHNNAPVLETAHVVAVDLSGNSVHRGESTVRASPASGEIANTISS